jgi:hypothetical protein
VAKQSRTKLKHRLPDPHAIPTVISIAEMLIWKAPAKAPLTAAVRRSNNPIEPKESQAFTLEGDFGGSCSKPTTEISNLVLSARAPGSWPIVSSSRCPTIRRRASSLAARGLASRRATVGGPALKKAIQLRVSGFAFYDGFHYSNADPQRGRDQGLRASERLWEIHPLWKVEFE